MKEAENGQEKKIKKLRTYFGNNLAVIKDNGLFKVLFKLTSMQMKEYNKALKKGQPTDNLTFQYSLNEFRLDLQMGKSTIIKKFDVLTNTGLLSVDKCKDEKNAYCKNKYQLNIEKLEVIIDTLNGMRRKERIEYINNLFNTKTSGALLNIKDDKIEEDNDDDTGFDTDNTAMKEMAKQMLKVNLQKQNPISEPVPKVKEILNDMVNNSGEEMDLSFLLPTNKEEEEEVIAEDEDTELEENEEPIVEPVEEITVPEYDYVSSLDFSEKLFELMQVKPQAAGVIDTQIKSHYYPNKEAVLKDIETNIKLYTKVVEKEKWY